jgi:hypothetical protein
MSRKHTHRKIWPLLPNAVQHVREGMAVTSDRLLDKLRMLELSALEAFRTGKAEPADWRALADMANICETMARTVIGPEALEPCMRAQEALGAAHARLRSVGRLALSGPELQSLRDLHEWHELQRTSVSRGEYEKAIQRTANRIKGAAKDLKVYV